MQTNNGNKNICGFTLVEMSMVLVIIAFIMSAILGGQSVIASAKLRKTVVEMTSYSTAINDFTKKFKYYPGDYPKANAYWSTTTSGNGNWVVAQYSEDMQAWLHLVQSGLINTSITGGLTGALSSAKLRVGTNLPISAIDKSSGYWFYTSVGSVYGRGTGLPLIELGTNYSASSTGDVCGPVLLPKDAKNIDNKIDDALAGTGNIFTINACGFTKASSDACVTGDAADATSDYNLQNTNKTCAILYYFNEK